MAVLRVMVKRTTGPRTSAFLLLPHVYESRPDAEAGAGASPLLSEAGTRNAPLWDTLADVTCDLAQSQSTNTLGF